MWTMRLPLGCCLLVCLSFGGCGDDAVSSQLRSLTEEYPSVNATQTKNRLDKLNVEEHWILELVGKQFKWAVMRRVCDADSNIVCTSLADKTRYDCAALDADWQTYVSWHKQTYGANADPNTNIDLTRGELLIYLKCKAGEIDQGSCDLYFQIKDNIANGAAGTSQVIIDNIGNKCTVGQDPGCYP
jgi:hypothetical protein